MSQISSMTCVTRCSPPRQAGRPGIVGSTSWRTLGARESSACRASSAASHSRFRVLAGPPTAFRAAASSPGSDRMMSVSAPFLRPRISVRKSWSRRSSACGTSRRRSRRPASRARRSLISEGLLRDLRQLLKRARIADGEIGEDFAVDFHAGLAQAVHQPVVREVVQPGGGVDARDPETAELAFLAAPIAVRIALRPLDALLGRLPQLAAPAEVAFGELHHLVLALQARDVALDPGHGGSLGRQEPLQAALVGVGNESPLAQMTFALGMLLRQDMALHRLVTAQPPR